MALQDKPQFADSGHTDLANPGHALAPGDVSLEVGLKATLPGDLKVPDQVTPCCNL